MKFSFGQSGLVFVHIALRPYRGFQVMDPEFRDILELYCINQPCTRVKKAETVAMLSNQIVSFVTQFKLSVVTFDIETIHVDIDTCINKHSGMIRDPKWPGVIHR